MLDTSVKMLASTQNMTRSIQHLNTDSEHIGLHSSDRFRKYIKIK